MNINRKAALASNLSLLCIAVSGVAALAAAKPVVKSSTKMAVKAPKVVAKTTKISAKGKTTSKSRVVARTTKAKTVAPKTKTGLKAKAL